MSGAELEFSRRLLTRVQAKVRCYDASVAGSSWVVPAAASGAWDFHGPAGFRWSGAASDPYAALAAGYCAWLAARGAA